MNIYAKLGTKVKFIGGELYRWAVDIENADVLVAGKIYTIDHTEIHSFHTKIYLIEHPKVQFDSSWFDDSVE